MPFLIKKIHVRQHFTCGSAYFYFISLHRRYGSVGKTFEEALSKLDRQFGEIAARNGFDIMLADKIEIVRDDRFSETKLETFRTNDLVAKPERTLCFRTACRQPGAVCRHTQNGNYYCIPCAQKINAYNPMLPPLVEIPADRRPYLSDFNRGTGRTTAMVHEIIKAAHHHQHILVIVHMPTMMDYITRIMEIHAFSPVRRAAPGSIIVGECQIMFALPDHNPDRYAGYPREMPRFVDHAVNTF